MVSEALGHLDTQGCRLVGALTFGELHKVRSRRRLRRLRAPRSFELTPLPRAYSLEDEWWAPVYLPVPGL